jgi:hypothetical protein
MTLIDLGSDYFEFWQYIEVHNLTGDGLVHFVENLPFDELTESIWQRIVAHLYLSRGEVSSDFWQKTGLPDLSPKRGNTHSL